MRLEREPISLEDKNTLEYHRKYRADNIEKRRQWNREWIENNREKYNAQKAKYRDKLKIEVFSYY
jgi:hypothetical protein